VRDQVSHPYKTTSRIMFLYILNFILVYIYYIYAYMHTHAHTHTFTCSLRASPCGNTSAYSFNCQ
jgi:uncharacterized membrane protein